MASTSTSSKTEAYRVYLNFHGEAVRVAFVDNLYKRLTAAGISSFREEDIRAGASERDSIRNAICNSELFIVVFSKEYPSSRTVLDHLIQILERRKVAERPVITIYLDKLCQSDVRNQTTGTCFGDAFAKYDPRPEVPRGVVNSWRRALAEAADLRGLFLEEHRTEAELIEAVVKEVREMPNPKDNKSCDVFLNFRGDETRGNFVDYLNEALKQAGFSTYFDDERVGDTEDFAEIMKGLYRSRMYIPVFSEHYASSTGPLDELVEILKLRKVRKCPVLPVFLQGVNPVDVERQSGSYGADLGQLEIDLGDEMHRVQDYRNALTEATGIKGKVWKPHYRTQDAFIQAIVKAVENNLKRDVPASC